MRPPIGYAAVRILAACLVAGCAGKGEIPGTPPDGAGAPKAGETTVETVLLTGFEPFGGAPLNPSWEAVRPLEGARIGGVRIRVLRLPVVWGEPLPALRRAVEAWRPVAVFSFGQGGKGALRFERVADNERRPFPDNRQRPPPSPTIREGGPASYESRFPFAEVVKAYDGPAWPLRESREAGGYLCEECLYALETLRDEVPWPMEVAFFHVPPLGSDVPSGGATTTCSAEELSACVRALVSAWLSLRKGGGPSDGR